MNESLKQHVALVTAASSGIGRAAALLLSAAGASVVCADLRPSADPEGFDANIEVDTVDLIKQQGGEAYYVKTDVRIAEEVRNAVQVAVQEFGRLDILVNVAGAFGSSKSILEATEEDFDFEMGVNGKGTWLCCKYGIEQMLKQEPLSDTVRGRIINLASIAALKAMPNSTMYCQSKASIVGLTRALALDWGKSGITVNALAPGLIRTAMARDGFEKPELTEMLTAGTPADRFGVPADIARAVLFLATDEAGFITGHTLPVDGGMAAI